jgi:hypothetical protein
MTQREQSMSLVIPRRCPPITSPIISLRQSADRLKVRESSGESILIAGASGHEAISRTKSDYRMKTRTSPSAVLIAAAILSLGKLPAGHAQVLVPNPFVPSYTNWVDPFATTRGGNWRVSLHNPTLIDTNNANPPTAGGGTNTGLYEPDVLIADNFVAPASYEVSAKMFTNDDDLLGLVWNFQDSNNYFRVGLRQQPNSGNFGGTEGLSVQKVVGGLVTQLAGPGLPSPVTQGMIDTRTPFDVKIAVTGTNYEVFFNGVSQLSGTDADLATGRKIGIQSWAQQSDVAAVTPYWGTEVESISVTQGATNLFNQTFANRPTRWRQVVMTNANGVNALSTGTTKEILGNFGLDVNDPWVLQHSNGFLNATVNNTDFIGPGIVVDEPGSLAFSDYEMRLRLGAADDDGMGILLRVQDDNNFYRITFTTQATDLAGARAPRGMSVQKVRNGVWTELFRDDDFAPLFVYSPGIVGSNPSTGLPMFDLSARALGNTLTIQVIDQFGTIINYPPIPDTTDPLLTGTVGLQTWGTENVYYMSYGGQPGPLLIGIPEPSTSVFVLGGTFAALNARLRRREVG